MKKAFKSKRFSASADYLVDRMDGICASYQAQGLTLTLRQLYYRLVAADEIPNTEKSYSRVGRILSDARLAGRIDWSAIVDRERALETWEGFEDVAQIMRSVSYGVVYDLWAEQNWQVEVWVEKKALIDVISDACSHCRVPHFACKGYVSQSALYEASRRILRYNKETVILYLGDHDPSGLDMPRDIRDRLAMFGCNPKVERIALTMSQIANYSPPPNPAKTTDSRFQEYRKRHGDESWELDALEPKTLITLIAQHLARYTDPLKFDKVRERERADEKRLQQLADRFDVGGWKALGIA